MLHPNPKTSRRRRFWGIALVSIAVFLVLIFAAVEIVLSTDIPRNLVVNLLERQFGLRLTAGSLSTGLMGHTTLNDVTLTLPLSDKAFLSIPRLKVNHTWLPGILFGSIKIQDIEIQKPNLTVLQDAGGSWNVDQVIQLLGRAGGGNNVQQNKSNDIPLLPNLDVADASITITDNKGRSAHIEHFDLTGRSEAEVVWLYHATVTNRLDLTGKLAPGGAWAHEVDLKIENAQAWFSPWVTNWPASARVDAKWSGRVSDGALTGRIDLQQLQYDAISAQGPLEFSSDGQTSTLRPGGLLVSDASFHSADVRILGGSIVFTSNGVQSQALGLEFAQGKASLDARYSFADSSASVHAAWRDLSVPSSAVQSGDLQFDFSAPLGLPRFNATFQDSGQTNSGKWDALLNLSGSGGNLKTLQLSVVAPRLRFEASSGKSLDLDGLTADIGSTANNVVLLRDLRVGRAHPIAGEGGYDLGKNIGWLSLDGHGWRMPGPSDGTVDLDLNVWASTERVHLQQFYLSSGLLSAYINGDYVYSLPKPVAVHAYFSESPSLDAVDADPEPFRGLLRSTIDLNGTVAPLDLALTGWARGRNVHVGRRPLGDVDVNLEGYLHEDRVFISSKNIQLLGGTWDISGYWPTRHTLFRIDNLSVQHLPLTLAADTNQIGGTLDGKWSIDVSELNPDGITINGSADVHDVVLGASGSALARYLSFDEVRLPNMHLEYGTISLQPIILSRRIPAPLAAATQAVARGATRSSGGEPAATLPAATSSAATSPAGFAKTAQAKIDLYTTVEHPMQIGLTLDADSFPVLPAGGDGDCLVTASASLDLDLGERTADGYINVRADTAWKSQPVGKIDTVLSVQRRVAQITSVKIDTLSGSATGSGVFDLDHPYSTLFKLDWKNLDLSGVKPLVPALGQLSGKTDGFIHANPATGFRPLAPLAIEVQVQSHGIKYKNTEIGHFQAYAFAGPGRIVLNDAPTYTTRLDIAGGTIDFWGRVARHEGDLYQSLVQLTLRNLELDTILPSGSKTARAPGLLSGQITIIGRPGAPQFATGLGELTLDKSDLAGIGPIAFLYNLMHLAHNADKPTGTGTIEFNLQSEDAYISAMRYFDKGTEIRISGSIGDLLDMPKCPLNLVAVGSVRPLAHLHIPGLADFDEAIGAIQHDAVTVKVSGLLDKPQEKAIPFGEIGQDMKNLLFGDLLSTKQ